MIIDDFVQIYNLGKMSPASIGGPFHFLNRRTNLEIVNFILERVKGSLSRIEFVKDRPGHDRRYAISADKIRDELGFVPETELEQGLSATVDRYLQRF